MLPIKYLIIEGVDCSGKSSLYSSLHKKTRFKYNIHDRSCLSMLCYARLYNRDESEHRKNLQDELCNGNNFFVVLMLPLEVILKRFRIRGDEFQDESSLTKLYEIFREETDKIKHLPNVLVVETEEDLKDMTDKVSKSIENYEKFTPKFFGDIISRWVELCQSKEIQFQSSFMIPVGHVDYEIMNHPHEGFYYSEILDECRNIINQEIQGINTYSLPQGKSSRRFYYSSNTCISSIHFLPREKTFKVICNLRSTDAVKNGSIDLRFLSHLASVIHQHRSWDTEQIQLDIKFNSLHIRS